MSERTRDELIHDEAHDVYPADARPDDCQICAALAPKSRVGYHCGTEYEPQGSCDSPELAAIRADDERQGLKVLPQNVRNTFVQHLMTQRRALLRMVDELELVAEQRKAWAFAWEAAAAKATKERDELRAKLANSESAYDGSIKRWQAACDRVIELEAKLAEKEEEAVDFEDKWGDEQRLRVELEAKLAEAEKDKATLRIELRETSAAAMTQKERAEAAEARYEARIKLLLADREAAEARVLALTEQNQKLNMALFAACEGHVDLDKLEGR